MKKIELFQKSKTGRVNHLIVVADDNKLITEWFSTKDDIKGKVQTTTEHIKGVNAGKANETSDYEQCILEWERKVKEKKEEGYSDSYENALTREDTIDIYERLPKEFAPCKPIKKFPKKETAIDNPEYSAERKHNGVCLLLHNTGKELIVYSRRIFDITAITSCVTDIHDKLKLVPEGSLVIGELVAFDEDGIENTDVLKGVTHDKTTSEKSLERYKELTGKGFTFQYKPYDLYFYKGEFLGKTRFEERNKTLESLFGKRDLFMLTKDIVNKASLDGWEGFIIRKEDGTISYTLNGDPNREGSYKYKFIKETDCFITRLAPGNGKHEIRFADFNLFQYSNGKLIDCGWAGPGKLTQEQLDALTRELVEKGYPIKETELKEEDWVVVELNYDARKPKNKKGQHCFFIPKIMRIRDDKDVKECTVERD